MFSLRSYAGESWLKRHVQEALAEDLGDAGDITCLATVPEDATGYAELRVKSDGILCGTDWAVETGRQTEPAVEWLFSSEDGARVHKGDVIATIEGSLRGILISERTALNGLGRLSGIATDASRYAEAIAGTSAVILDTRKTTPGWRLAEKYAVKVGGGANHRIGLYDEILIKENHIEASGGVEKALQAALEWRSAHSEERITPIEIEVENLDQLRTALAFSPDRVLLDNFTTDQLREAVRIAGSKVTLEASGGITLENIRDVANSGVHRISSGALTHSFRPLDLSLRVRNT